MPKNFLKNKKVLLVGLGRLGGGISTAKFFVKNKAHLTVTDMQSREALKKSINQIKNLPLTLHLGEHQKKDFLKNDIIIFNPAVSVFSYWARFAKAKKKRFFNDYTFFCYALKKGERIPHKGFIGITGTRGKTTITNWVSHFIKGSIKGGNIPTASLFKIMSRITLQSKVVLELSSYQLEYVDKKTCAPRVAIITNLFPDHLNRYGDMKTYAKIKAKIFTNQKKEDVLILNAQNKWTPYFLKQKPNAKVFYFSGIALRKKQQGLGTVRGEICFFNQNRKEILCALPDNLSTHQIQNLLAAMLGAYLYGVSWATIIGRIATVPSIPFRQEKIYQDQKRLVINDSASTSPQATIAAIETFANTKPLFLICGGTDKKLSFAPLALAIKKNIAPQNLFLLDGSATKKLLKDLKKEKYVPKKGHLVRSFKDIKPYLKKIKKGAIIFSPGAASFEKFKNEFDRGKKFNNLIKKIFND